MEVILKKSQDMIRADKMVSKDADELLMKELKLMGYQILQELTVRRRRNLFLKFFNGVEKSSFLQILDVS
eukprot:snap_masked-scaffold_2-processed-gene-15.20-mRNA-1 protein AED:1.00 eAED:1.00 QI:0/0/0/0/1/1/2/0/69